MTTRVGIQGASGKTGSLILSVLPEFPAFSLGAAIVGPDCTHVEKAVADGVCLSRDVDAAMTNVDCWIDFSTPWASVELARRCAQYGKPLLIATTGHSDADRAAIAECARRAPMMIVPNTSLGVFATKEASLLVQSLLGNSFDIEVSEMHHRLKKDAPSGTALFLANALAARNETPLVHDRTARHSERPHNEIGMSVQRGGDVAGEHTVYFIGNGERIELTHRVWDRKIFARGALSLVERLAARPAPGLYTLQRDFFL